MISSILNSKLPVATIVAGKAMSCGAILFAFGTEGFRFMDPHATLMIHDAYQGIHGKVQDLKIDVKHLEATNKSLYKRMAEHLGHSADYFTNLIRKNKHVDWFLDAKEAKRHKLANHLRIPSMESTINVGYIFG
jgi:ATP-dependent protease ClpP protease subunit